MPAGIVTELLHTRHLVALNAHVNSLQTIHSQVCHGELTIHAHVWHWKQHVVFVSI